MQPQETIQIGVHDDFANLQEGQQCWVSALLVAAHVFVVTSVVFIVRFDHWGLALGWMPATVIAAAFGWFGYCHPWIGQAIAILWEMISILSLFS